MNEQDQSAALAPKTNLHPGGNEGLPKVGEWYWIEHEAPEQPREVGDSSEEEISDEDDENTAEEFSDEEGLAEDENPSAFTLCCVERVYSNHVLFLRFQAGGNTSFRIRHENLMACTRFEPHWRKHITEELEQVQLAIQDATKALIEDAVKKNALPPQDEAAAAPSRSGLELSLRVVDPAKQKADILAIQERAKATEVAISALSKEYAGLCKNLCASELFGARVVAKQLEALEGKIFIIEVYAGLQEHVLQIAEGEPANIGEKITVRQSMLFMDEETLIDYKGGGMDFNSLGDFDKWVCRPENLERVLPNKRGVCAWRVRRHQKDYGWAETISEALKHMAWHSENFRTYLLIRNGGNVYRIASSVDFSPRLIPYRTEFDRAFVQRDKWGSYNSKTSEYEYKEEEIRPQDFRYDDKVDEVKKRLLSYNRIVVLIQGLLDRSDVFHPHVNINLSSGEQIDEWLNLLRDEEDVIEWNGPHWKAFLNANRLSIQPGDWIYSDHDDIGRHGYDSQPRPGIIKVDKVRGCNKADVAKYESENNRRQKERGYGRNRYPESVDEPKVGTPGVEVSWTFEVERYSKEYTIPVPERPGYYRRGHWTEERTRRQWLPLHDLINLSAYRCGEFKQFLADRHQKADYEQWVKYFFEAEKWLREQREESKTTEQTNEP